MSHTPTPWKIFDWNKVDALTKSAKGFDGFNSLIICSPVKEGSIASISRYGAKDETAEANAAFIVRACNSHDALMSALKTANHVLGILLQSDSGTYAEAQEQIKSALALAK